MAWVIRNRSQFPVNVGRSNGGVWVNAQNDLKPGQSVRWEVDQRPFELFIFLNDGENLIDVQRDNTEQTLATASTTIGAVSAVFGVALLFFPPTAPLGAVAIAASCGVAGAGFVSSAIGVAQAVDDVLSAPATFRELSGRDDMTFELSGGYLFGKLVDGRTVAIGTEALTVGWTNTTRGTSGTRVADEGDAPTTAPSSSGPPPPPDLNAPRLPRPPGHGSMPPALAPAVRRARLSEGWDGVQAMTALGGVLYAVYDGDLYRVDPGDGTTEHLAADLESTVEMVGVGGHLYLRRTTPQGPDEILKLRADGSDGTIETAAPTEAFTPLSQRSSWVPPTRSRVKSIASFAGLLAVNDGSLGTISPDGVAVNLRVNGPFGQIAGSETGLFVAEIDDNGETSSVVWFPEILDNARTAFTLPETSGAMLLTFARPHLYFVRETQDDQARWFHSLWAVAVKDGIQPEAPVELFRWLHTTEVRYLTAASGGLFAIENGTLVRTAIDRFEGPPTFEVALARPDVPA